MKGVMFMEKVKNNASAHGVRMLLFSVFAALAICLLLISPAEVHAAPSGYYRVTGTKNYLALRTAPSYDQANEIGKLHNGDTVLYVNSGNGTYWYVSTAIGDGYVNKNYLTHISGSSSSKNTLTVKGTSNYLALRSAKKYDSSNEIGKLKNGQTALLIRKDDSGYWLVYAPSAGKFGYVNGDYLVDSSGKKPTGSMNNMYVAVGMNNYLALRTAMTYNSANEIGKIHFGQPVEYISAGNSEYCFVYAPTLDKYGYVNKNYLLKIGDGTNSGVSYTSYKVKGVDQYLALRTAKAYKDSNEIGKIKNNQRVEYVASGDSTYWFVYAPTLGKYGYVNKNFLS